MAAETRLYKNNTSGRRFIWGDVVVLVGLALLLYAGTRLALRSPAYMSGPEISLELSALPGYAGLSLGRMVAAYLLSILFSLVYGYLAAYHRSAEQVLMPVLDVLQSVPILSFLPVVLLGLAGIFPQNVAAEIASIILIFTSQAWNLTFAWYQSLSTIPKDLREASKIFHFNGWMRFKTMELPFAAISLIWNSMMSWAGGWFFLMAAEIFTVGNKDFRLPGLGAYLHEAANQGNVRAILWGLGTLVLLVVVLDQLVWRPLLAWSDRFKIEMVESDNPPTSWFYHALHTSRLLDWLGDTIFRPLSNRFDRGMIRIFPFKGALPQENTRVSGLRWGLRIAGAGIGLYGVIQIGQMLSVIPLSQWGQVALGVGATFLRVVAALIIALAWTIPVGVMIGTNRKLSGWLQPVVQVVASIPATALFPVLLLALLTLKGGVDLAAVLLMLLGTQWYLLFNIIAGASAIPQDLKFTSSLLGFKGIQRWRTLYLPALFPYMVTGAITASGGAWNASIVAEYVAFGGKIYHTTGIGALIASATASGNYPLLLAATLALILTVTLVNRLFWRRLYDLAESKYRME